MMCDSRLDPTNLGATWLTWVGSADVGSAAVTQSSIDVYFWMTSTKVFQFWVLRVPGDADVGMEGNASKAKSEFSL